MPTLRAESHMTADVNSIERLLRDAVVALSLPAAEQCRVTLPGCVSCELLNDFDHAYTCYRQSLAERLTPDRADVLAKIDKTMNLMSPSDCVCYDTTVLDRPAWAGLRHLALEAVMLFGWQDYSLNPYLESEPGVWKRPGTREE
jgi:hypothetical protein